VAYAARKGGGRKRPATGWASLTPAELEVVRLASEGLLNDAIARRLFITPGTVKVHLTQIFAKLGITTRAELAARAASHDLTARLSREQDMYPLSRRHTSVGPKTIRCRPEETICMPPPRQPA
jgi:DNA-binding CsgD family transcriptional regulator